MSHNHQKKIATINDFSGFGHCSIAIALPLISHLGIQCCPLPTAVFSNHMGFSSCYFEDCTGSMAPYMAEWKKLGLEFEGILTGFFRLCSADRPGGGFFAGLHHRPYRSHH